MQKLTFLKTVILEATHFPGISLRTEEEMGIIEAGVEEMHDIMCNPLIIESFIELGATHWELTEVLNGKVELSNIPDNFYGQDNDSYK